MLRFPPTIPLTLILVLCGVTLCLAVPGDVTVDLARRDDGCDAYLSSMISSRQGDCMRADMSGGSTPSFCDETDYGVDMSMCSTSGSSSTGGGGGESGSSGGYGSSGSGSGSDTGGTSSLFKSSGTITTHMPSVGMIVVIGVGVGYVL